MKNKFHIYHFIVAILFLILFPKTVLKSVAPQETIGFRDEIKFIEMHRIRIENKLFGRIEVSEDKGKSWRYHGKVNRAVKKVNPKGFTASKWGQVGCVTAVACNAIHIKISDTVDEEGKERGVIFGILPHEEGRIETKGWDWEYPSEVNIYTDIKAGTSIFGGGYSPYVGNKVFLETKDGLIPIKEGYKPKLDDVFVILVERPLRYPREIVIENKYGGLVKVIYPDGVEEYIAQVVRPVHGTGRFEGSIWTDLGGIRANHPGVICISLSYKHSEIYSSDEDATRGIFHPIKADIRDVYAPRVIEDHAGGFQIIPVEHIMSSEMKGARTITPWLGIGPLNPLEQSSPHGKPPLFSYFLQPDQNVADRLKRFLVVCKMEGDEFWRPLPLIKGLALDSLMRLTHIRILFPIE